MQMTRNAFPYTRGESHRSEGKMARFYSTLFWSPEITSLTIARDRYILRNKEEDTEEEDARGEF